MPETLDLLPRDYDCALCLPEEVQTQIVSDAKRVDIWPRMLDPKCIVIVVTTQPSRRYHWFVRLSLTPNILRLVPPLVCSRTIHALKGNDLFTTSTLLTDYSEAIDEFPDVRALGWERGGDDGRLAPIDRGKGPTMVVGICAVCLTLPANRVFIPCGHAALCHVCEKNWEWRNCPLCRDVVRHTNPFFSQ